VDREYCRHRRRRPLHLRRRYQEGRQGHLHRRRRLTVTLVATDDDGAASIGSTANLTVSNVKPVADAGGPYTGDEGSAIPLDGSANDPGDNDDAHLTYLWTVNTAGIDAGGQCTFDDATKKNAEVTCTDDSKGGTFTLTLVATDDDGASSIGSDATLTVNNVAPVADAGPDDYTGYEGAPVQLHGLGHRRGQQRHLHLVVDRDGRRHCRRGRDLQLQRHPCRTPESPSTRTYGGSGWAVYGGTSVAAPIIAATYALGGLPGANGLPGVVPVPAGGRAQRRDLRAQRLVRLAALPGRATAGTARPASARRAGWPRSPARPPARPGNLLTNGGFEAGRRPGPRRPATSPRAARRAPAPGRPASTAAVTPAATSSART